METLCWKSPDGRRAGLSRRNRAAARTLTWSPTAQPRARFKVQGPQVLYLFSPLHSARLCRHCSLRAEKALVKLSLSSESLRSQSSKKLFFFYDPSYETVEDEFETAAQRVAVQLTMAQTKPLVLVTGASGLLGRSVLAAVKADTRFRVLGTSFSRPGPDLITCDLRDEAQCVALVEKNRPDLLIHCAAERKPASLGLPRRSIMPRSSISRSDTERPAGAVTPASGEL